MSLLLGLFAVARAVCVDTMLLHSFSECDLSGSRMIVFRWRNCTEATPVPTVIRCDFECEAGAFLTADSARMPTCEVCPANTYSLGGGVVHTSPFPRLFQYFNPRCISLSRRQSLQCPTWRVSANSLYIETAEGVVGERYRSELLGNFFVRKPGKLRVKYRLWASRLLGKATGRLVVQCNGVTIWEDADISPLWRSVDFSLSQRDYEIRLIHEFQYTEVPSRLEIAEIAVPGLSAASEHCVPCAIGSWSRIGAQECSKCKQDWYFDAAAQGCVKCPENRYSDEGSSGVGSCESRRPCMEKDYRETAGKCVDGIRDIEWEWVSPIRCDYKASELPAVSRNETCQECERGYIVTTDPYTHETVCQQCASGSYASDSTCLTCPSGTYAPKVLNFTLWNPLPPGFATTCISSTYLQCIFGDGWVPYRGYISSSLSYHFADSEPLLLREVNITAQPAFVEFRYRFVGRERGAELFLMVDNVKVWSDDGIGQNEETARWELQAGPTLLTWGFRGVNATAHIFQVMIVGAEEGVSSQCVACPDGFFSRFAASACEPCPPGLTSNPTHQDCVKCPAGYYTNEAGRQCRKCAPNTVSSEDATACVSPPLLQVDDHTSIDIQPLAHASSGAGICASSQLAQFCKDQFFGPIAGSNRIYYLSILTPGTLALVNTFPSDALNRSYAFAVDKTDTKGDKECREIGQSYQFSLGTEVTAVSAGKEGVVVAYGKGSKCGLGEYRSTVALSCDSRVEVGWPVVMRENECFVEFQWTNKYACPICAPSQVTNETTLCRSGIRTKTILPPHTCLWSYSLLEEEQCSELREFLFHIESVLGAAAVVAVSAVVVWGCKAYMREKRKLGVLLQDRTR